MSSAKWWVMMRMDGTTMNPVTLKISNEYKSAQKHKRIQIMLKCALFTILFSLDFRRIFTRFCPLFVWLRD